MSSNTEISLTLVQKAYPILDHQQNMDHILLIQMVY